MTDPASALAPALIETALSGLPAPRRGKVRDVYDLGGTLLVVASDRLSAYDHVLSPGIPDKGKILNQLTTFWFRRLADVVPHHLLATAPEAFPAALAPHRDLLRGRAVVVRKAEVIPFECVARGYLAGSALAEYRAHGTACGVPLPPGLARAARLPEPVFTPATKAATGHDENVPFARLVADLGAATASRLRDLTLALYRRAATHAEACGLLLADTKFEFGWADGELLLIDEALTPDSSRYWDAERWRPGEEPASFDKQFVRNWLDASGWDRESPPPPLPAEVVAGTRDRYLEAFRRLTGREPEL
ncbi:MAG: phosphoribosylaminoimidazolesuccinocarboxamide synthase [Thermoanaerobaculia bacterium]|nr:phosphoribosylaminoimidazolesuccinocarboxamide synthase [Thermoanaerobaculia bacterium]MCZ7650916.1 phosphoribosylaminoimidazolesuccinocarboxamide synthase [Thermoanaerobaculia bacterium]